MIDAIIGGSFLLLGAAVTTKLLIAFYTEGLRPKRRKDKIK